MTVHCSKCGQEWGRDPALEVSCPSCSADVGQQCRRPSEHPAPIHADRDRRALREVEGYERCSAESPVSVEPDSDRQLTFEEVAER